MSFIASALTASKIKIYNFQLPDTQASILHAIDAVTADAYAIMLVGNLSQLVSSDSDKAVAITLDDSTHIKAQRSTSDKNQNLSVAVFYFNPRLVYKVTPIRIPISGDTQIVTAIRGTGVIFPNGEQHAFGSYTGYLEITNPTTITNQSNADMFGTLVDFK